jgi:transcriptional antiterminator
MFVFVYFSSSYSAKIKLQQKRVKLKKQQNLICLILKIVLLQKVDCKMAKNQTITNWWCKKTYSRNHVTFEFGADLVRSYNKGLIKFITRKVFSTR